MKWHTSSKTALFLSLLPFFWCFHSDLLSKKSQPNVILIITDDQGYGDLSAHGNPVLRTPNMDKLHGESVRLTDFHVAPMCSPTRGQLLTGIDAMKNGCTAVCQGRSMMRNELPSMADFFIASNYRTGHFGKWHLGDSPPHRPQDRGFQETVHHRAWGITSLADHWENHTEVYFDPMLSHNGFEKRYAGYCTDIFFDESIRWMSKQKKEGFPFFTFLATNTPHVPNICEEKYSKPYQGKHKGKKIPDTFYGMIANLDANLGKLEKFLQENGLKENTIMIFMTDNGTQSSQAQEIFNAGMRARKTSVYEGGHRVPCFIRWPDGNLIHGTNLDELTQVQDLLPTLIDLCGLQNSPKTEEFDGISLGKLLQGEAGGLPDRKLVIQYRTSGKPWDPAVVLWEKWRLVNGHELYHVGRDPGQMKDIANEQPAVFRAMSDHYNQWYEKAKPFFDRTRWIEVREETILYAQDWTGDYCDNRGGLTRGTAKGYWNLIVNRAGEYEVEIRRWPKESKKTLTEGYLGKNDRSRSARPIATASLEIGGKKMSRKVLTKDAAITFRISLSAGKTQLRTMFYNVQGEELCSAMYAYLKPVKMSGKNRIDPGTAVDRTNKFPILAVDQGSNASSTVLETENQESGKPPIHQTPEGDLRTPVMPHSPSKKPPNSEESADKGEILIANFENGYEKWDRSGDAFLPGSRRNRISGHIGQGLANSYHKGDRSMGSILSPTFLIDRKYIKFLIGGGKFPGEVGIELLIEGQSVRSATGNSLKNENKEEILEWKSWVVSEFQGMDARIRVFDKREAGWGHVLVDQILQSDKGLISSENSLALSSFETPRKSDITLKDEWSTFPLYNQVGYGQSLRPQFHFTSRMGWLNDPNGMVYYDGEWHMLFQHFAKGNASGAKSWGNSVSSNLIHWEQLPHAINPYPKIDGSEGVHAIWSGSAVVDVNNALGKQKGETKTLFALYSATHEKFFQGGAFSTDKGRTWNKINGGRAVIPHQDGFAKGQRDPRVFHYAPGNFYVTIMMIGGPDRLVRLWKSKNLLDWKIIGDIPGKAAECIDMYEVSVDGDPQKRKWVIADAGTNYEVGEFDGKSWRGYGDSDKSGRRLRFDYGDAYYAAQAFNQGPNGRVVHIGWLRSKQAGYRPFLDSGMPFTQQMSVPAEVTLRTTAEGIRMFRNPVREIENLYMRNWHFQKLSLGELNPKLEKIEPELIDMSLSFMPKQTFTVSIRGLDIHYNPDDEQLRFTNFARVQGERSAWNKKGPYRDDGVRAIPSPSIDGMVKIRVLIDRASLELFVNDGQAAASFVVVPEAGNRKIFFKGNSNLRIINLSINELRSIWAE